MAGKTRQVFYSCRTGYPPLDRSAFYRAKLQATRLVHEYAVNRVTHLYKRQTYHSNHRSAQRPDADVEYEASGGFHGRALRAPSKNESRVTSAVGNTPPVFTRSREVAAAEEDFPSTNGEGVVSVRNVRIFSPFVRNFVVLFPHPPWQLGSSILQQFVTCVV